MITQLVGSKVEFQTHFSLTLKPEICPFVSALEYCAGDYTNLGSNSALPFNLYMYVHTHLYGRETWGVEGET